MHDNDVDHEHPENFEIGPNAIIEEIEGLEMFSLKSVGIDIGSSTSHLVFSRITLRREGAALSGRFRVTNREVLYRSEIMLTPYLSGTQIDTDKVKRFIEETYKDAGFKPEDDCLPKWMTTDAVGPQKAVWDVPSEIVEQVFKRFPVREELFTTKTTA